MWWLHDLRYQAITWTKLDVSSMSFINMHLWTLSDILEPSITWITLKNHNRRYYWNIPWAIELNSMWTSVFPSASIFAYLIHNDSGINIIYSKVFMFAHPCFIAHSSAVITAHSVFTPVTCVPKRVYLVVCFCSQNIIFIIFRNQKMFIRWYHKSRHETDIMLWHSDVTLRLSSFAI